jgi:hypothetical protein
VGQRAACGTLLLVLGITDLSTYLVGLALVILMPGPNSLYVLSVAARRGIRAGYQAAFGVFCGDAATYADVVQRLSTEHTARLFGVSPERLKRFDIADLHVVKFSLPRPVVQGSRYDRDMHGAQWAALLSEAELGE